MKQKLILTILLVVTTSCMHQHKDEQLQKLVAQYEHLNCADLSKKYQLEIAAIKTVEKNNQCF